MPIAFGIERPLGSVRAFQRLPRDGGQLREVQFELNDFFVRVPGRDFLCDLFRLDADFFDLSLNHLLDIGDEFVEPMGFAVTLDRVVRDVVNLLAERHSAHQSAKTLRHHRFADTLEKHEHDRRLTSGSSVRNLRGGSYFALHRWKLKPFAEIRVGEVRNRPLNRAATGGEDW